MTTDELYMHRCIELASLAAGSVAPNPMVGAVLVYDNKIIGEGYHRRYGQPHAEVNCIRDAALRFAGNELASSSLLEMMLQKSTLYVSLEPCAHYGKTPPCADLIIEKKIPAVVIGCRDPFPQVSGKGIEKLLAAGIGVTTGVLQQPCMDLNKRFFTHQVLHRPYIILKWAQSHNRKIAAEGSERTLISSDISNRLVHKWRSEESSILVGTTTALTDDPALTNRLWTGTNPVRLVLDKHLQLPGTLKLFEGVRTIVFNYMKNGEEGNAVYYKIKKENPVVREIVAALYSLNIQSVLVEGGAKLLQSFINENLWDEARVITNTEMEIASGTGAPVLSAVTVPEKETYGQDEVHIYKPVR